MVANGGISLARVINALIALPSFFEHTMSNGRFAAYDGAVRSRQGVEELPSLGYKF